MTNLDFPRQIGELFQTHNTFLVAGHIRPDCDVLGSQIALGLALQGLGKNVEIWNSDGVPSAYSFLPQQELVRRPPPEKHAFDVVVAVDTANYERLGIVRDRISSHKILINIDHHGSNPRYGDLNWIEPKAAASGELVYGLLRANAWAITPSIAANLLAAISTDTGSFQYPSTTPQSLRIAASLMEAGANLGELSRLCYSSYPVRRVRLLQAVLGTLKLVSNERIGILWLTPELYQQAGARREDSEGLIDHIRGINTLLIAMVFEQIEENCIRISLRSKSDTISVDSIARQFGGGGHPMAAGVTIKGEASNVEAMVVKAATEAIQDGNV
jgi:phosphoesterase RecJ-like protein